MLVRAVIIAWCFVCTIPSYGQLYVLKDHRPDSAKLVPHLFDSLPELCDSLDVHLKRDEGIHMKEYVPTFRFLKSTFDTLNVEYDDQKVIYRRQMLLQGLEKDYRKVRRTIEKDRLRWKGVERNAILYDYGRDEKGNRFCYVTVPYQKKKKKYELRFVSLQLMGKWFLADKFVFERTE